MKSKFKTPEEEAIRLSYLFATLFNRSEPTYSDYSCAMICCDQIMALFINKECYDVKYYTEVKEHLEHKF